MIEHVPRDFRRIGVDLNPHTIQALIGIRGLLELLPGEVSEDTYKALKGLPPDPITSWVRFVCSFGGRFENGYARQRGSSDDTFQGIGLRNARGQSSKLRNYAMEGLRSGAQSEDNLGGGGVVLRIV